MATKGKGARQQAVRRARIAAAERAAQRKNTRKRWIVLAALAALIMSVVLGAVVVSATSKSSNAASGPPCVAMTDDPPVGAPYVPVHVGPPPKQLVVEEMRAGTGAAVQPGDSVTVDYVGVACSTGKIFDSSYAAGQPSHFALSDVIPGWQQGIPGMQVGGQRLLGIPPNLAYGNNSPPGIGPNETLWFAIELRSIDATSSTTTAPGTPSSPTTVVPPVT